MTRDEAEVLRRDPKNWRFGMIYVCKTDPRIIVRNFFYFGWTWNFGHRFALPALLMTVLIIVGPVYLMAMSGNVGKPVLLATFFTGLAVMVAIANYVATGPR